MVWLQDSILEHLHYHILSNILWNMISKAHCAWILSCFSLRPSVWLITWPIFLGYWLIFPVFSIVLWIQLGLPHPSIIGILWCMFTHPIDLMGIHLLRCAHGNEHTGTHDVVRDTFVVIAWDVGFHMWWQQLHALFSNTVNSSCRWIDIVFTKDGICTLLDIVIANPTWVDLLPQSYATQGFVVFDATQARKWVIATNTSPVNSSL